MPPDIRSASTPTCVRCKLYHYPAVVTPDWRRVDGSYNTYSNSAIVQTTLTHSERSDDTVHSCLGLEGRWGHIPQPNPTFKLHHVLQVYNSMRDFSEIFVLLRDHPCVEVRLLKTDQIYPAWSVVDLSGRGRTCFLASLSNSRMTKYSSSSETYCTQTGLDVAFA
jgi:hypothetical protein